MWAIYWRRKGNQKWLRASHEEASKEKIQNHLPDSIPKGIEIKIRRARHETVTPIPE